MLEEYLSPGERLYLERWRAKQRLSDAAAQYGVPDSVYRAWETDQNEAPEVELSRGLDINERYVILRHRSGLTLKAIADMIGVHITIVGRMERGTRSIKRLAEFWGDI